jgi:hypothetical protein
MLFVPPLMQHVGFGFCFLSEKPFNPARKTKTKELPQQHKQKDMP